MPQTQLITTCDGGYGLPMALAISQYMACTNRAEEACGKCVSCNQFKHGNYADLHLFFPFSKVVDGKDVDSGEALYPLFYNALKENPFLTQARWQAHLVSGNRQLIIPVSESKRFIKATQTKVLSDKPRFIIIWMPELLHLSAANRLLKTLEEPGDNTYIFLISNAADQILPTIKSRCVAQKMPNAKEKDIITYLHGLNFENSIAQYAAVNAAGSLGLAFDYASGSNLAGQFAELFAKWMRLLYSKRIVEAVNWVDEAAAVNREELKWFLRYSSNLINQAVKHRLTGAPITIQTSGFSLEKFAPFVNTAAIDEIYTLFEDALRDIGRNGNAKLVMMSLTLQLFKYIGQA